MKKIVFGLLGVLLLGIIFGYGASWFFQQQQDEPEEVHVVVSEVKPTWEIQLYFTAPTGDYLIPETFEIPICDEDIDCIRNLLDGLITGSRHENISVLPKETKVLGVEVENDLVRVNFSRQLVDFHPGGSSTELFSIYSLANSLNENFPYLRQLQILIEGEALQTLKGHVRIDQPIYADFSFGHPPVSGVTDSPIDGKLELSIDQILQNANKD